tara:strand:- start:44 stop:745 length:702 start_codon:yes stop_codon:yes gene_type:complete
MATTYATNDNYIYKYSTATWDAARSASTATLGPSFALANRVYNQNIVGRGGTVSQIGRFFLEFDTSDIPSVGADGNNIELGTFNLLLYGWSVGTLDLIVVKGTQGTTLSGSDYNSISLSATALSNSDGSGAGSLAGDNSRAYSDEVETWSTIAYNTIALNQNAKDDAISNDRLTMCVMGYTWDYLDIDPIDTSASTEGFGLYRSANHGTSKDPKIVWTYTESGEDANFFGTNF